jgi:hypothetical protein
MRFFVGLCLLSIFPSTSPAADTYVLASQRKLNDLSRVKVELEVGGDLKVVDQGKVKPLAMSVVAKIAYDELLFEAAGGQLRAARYYDPAEAVIKIEKGGEKPVPGAAGEPAVDWRRLGLRSDLAVLSRRSTDPRGAGPDRPSLQQSVGGDAAA